MLHAPCAEPYPNVVVLNKSAVLHMNINAAKGIHDVHKTNLRPNVTIKMKPSGHFSLVSCCHSSSLGPLGIITRSPSGRFAGRSLVPEDILTYNQPSYGFEQENRQRSSRRLGASTDNGVAKARENLCWRFLSGKCHGFVVGLQWLG